MAHTLIEAAGIDAAEGVFLELVGGEGSVGLAEGCGKAGVVGRVEHLFEGLCHVGRGLGKMREEK